MTSPLARAWILLLVLSAGSTAIAVALPSLNGAVLRGAVLALLVLAWLKARVILMRYLGLADVPVAARAFQTGLGLFMIAAAALYLLG